MSIPRGMLETIKSGFRLPVPEDGRFDMNVVLNFSLNPARSAVFSQQGRTPGTGFNLEQGLVQTVPRTGEVLRRNVSAG